MFGIDVVIYRYLFCVYDVDDVSYVYVGCIYCYTIIIVVVNVFIIICVAVCVSDIGILTFCWSSVVCIITVVVVSSNII